MLPLLRSEGERHVTALASGSHIGAGSAPGAASTESRRSGRRDTSRRGTVTGRRPRTSPGSVSPRSELRARSRCGRSPTVRGRSRPTPGAHELAATLFVVAGLGLIAAGLITGRRRRLVGGLAVVAGLVWFAPAWEGWEGGPALPRAAAMLAAPLVLPVLVHLVLVAVMPTLSRSALVVIIATYALVGVPRGVAGVGARSVPRPSLLRRLHHTSLRRRALARSSPAR